ncbi:PAS domain S-box protein [Solimonas sp. K1W22B-7]|nr:PAS domain S-box protein [Solimonas sp. K1W22B-7]
MLAGQHGEALFRLAVEASPSAMVVVDQRGDIRLVNQQAERLFGYPRSEMLGQRVEMLVPQRNRERHPGMRGGYLSHPDTRPMGSGRDLYGLTREGHEVPIEIGLNPLKTEEGTFILASIIDITERKRSAERFRLVVEAAPNAMIMVDAEGRITLVNAQTENLFGYPRSELIGRPVEMLVPHGHRSHHPGLREGYFARPQTRSMGVGRDLYGQTRDGRQVPIEIGLNPIETADGLFVLASIIDITERKRAELELRTLNQTLALQIDETTAALGKLQVAQGQLVQAEKLASLGSLVAGIAHEINTPVGIGVTAASHLDMEVRSMDQAVAAGSLTRSQFERFRQSVAQSSDIILMNLRRAAELIQSFKRVAVDQSSDERRRIRLKAYFEEVLVSLRPKMKATPHRIELDCPEDLQLDTIPGAWSQVLTNLVVNALSHAFEPGRPGLMRIVVDSDDSAVRVRFHDDGRGIAAENLGRIFDPFFTTRRGQGGTGLGLHIVFNIVHQTLGGSIAVDSSLGAGTCFTIGLPRAQPHGRES